MPNAVSLKQIIGVEFPVGKVLERLCELLEARYLQLRSGKFTQMKSDYISHLYWFDELHDFKTKTKKIQGRIVDVLRNGQLQIEQINGEINDFDIKEIEFVD